MEMGHLYSPVMKEKKKKEKVTVVKKRKKTTSYSFGGGVGNKFLLNCIKYSDK